MFETDFEKNVDEPPTQSYKLTGGQFAIWLSGMLAVSLGYALWLGYSSRVDARIAQRERTAIGVITSVGSNWSKHPRNHYRFSFAGTAYEGADIAYPFLGKKVTVYLDPDDPSTNSLTQFSTESKRSHDNMISLLYVSVGLGIVSAIVWTNLIINKDPEENEQPE
jgi:hypothetical protein